MKQAWVVYWTPAENLFVLIYFLIQVMGKLIGNICLFWAYWQSLISWARNGNRIKKKKGEERESAGFESYQTSPWQRQEASAQFFDQSFNLTKNFRKQMTMIIIICYIYIRDAMIQPFSRMRPIRYFNSFFCIRRYQYMYFHCICTFLCIYLY